MTPIAAWAGAHGCLTVQRLAGMLPPVTFLLPSGKQVGLMEVSSWAQEPEAAALLGILRALCDERPCVPLGCSVAAEGWPQAWRSLVPPGPAAEGIRGHSSSHALTWLPSGDGSMKLGIDYSGNSPVRRRERVVRPDPTGAAPDVRLTVRVRDACRPPLGLHPTFRLPARPGAARLGAGRFDHRVTCPAELELGAVLFASDRRFDCLAAVPVPDGSVRDDTTLPFGDAGEDPLQLNRVEGAAALAHRAEGFRVRLHWQREYFASLLLWFSNRGRTQSRWRARHQALGIEPIYSPFGLGAAIVQADSPIAGAGTPTARAFAADETFVTSHRIEAEAL